MTTIRLTALLVEVIGAITLYAASPVWAQQKYPLSGAPSTRSQYLQEHAIDVGDVPGHRVRVYEIRYDYPEHDYALAGVAVKELFSRCISDYVNQSGPFTCYQVYTLEDGNKVFSRTTGTSQSDGAGGLKLVFVENFSGGSGKFRGMRGQVRGSGERAPGAKSLTLQSNGECWIEE